MKLFKILIPIILLLTLSLFVSGAVPYDYNITLGSTTSASYWGGVNITSNITGNITDVFQHSGGTGNVAHIYNVNYTTICIFNFSTATASGICPIIKGQKYYVAVGRDASPGGSGYTLGYSNSYPTPPNISQNLNATDTGYDTGTGWTDAGPNTVYSIAGIRTIEDTPASPPAPSSSYIFLLNQTPVNITAVTLFTQSAIVSFNYTGNSTYSPYLNYTLNHSSTSACMSFTNGSCVFLNNTVYQKSPSSWVNRTGEATLNYTFDENELYPTNRNLNESYFFTPHTTQTLTTSARLVKVEIINVTGERYNILEIMANTTTSAKVYICNSSYSTGNIYSSPFCLEIGTLNSSTYNHSHSSNVAHNVFSFGIINSKVNNILTYSSTMYVILTGSSNYYTVGTNSRTGATQTSVSSGVAWTSETFTPDLHLHTYDSNEYLRYTAVGLVNNTNSTNSSYSSELIDLPPLAPTNPAITNPLDTVQNTTYLNITWSASNVQTVGVTLTNYTIHLLNSDYTFNKQIAQVGNTTNNYYWNVFAENLSLGTYYVKVIANDSAGQQTQDIESFTLTANTVTDIVVKYGTIVLTNGSVTVTNLNTSESIYIPKTYINKTIELNSTQKSGVNCGYGTNPTNTYDGDFSTFGTATVGEYCYFNYSVNISQDDYNPATTNLNIKHKMGGAGIKINNLTASQLYNTNILQLRGWFTNTIGTQHFIQYLNTSNGWETLYNTTTATTGQFFDTNLTITYLNIGSGNFSYNGIKNNTYQYFADFTGYAYKYDNHSLTSSLYSLYNMSLSFTNSVQIYIYDENTATLITQNITIVTSGTSEQTNYTTSGSLLLRNLTDGTYTIKLSGANYTQKTYTVTVTNRSSQTLNAYLSTSADTTIIQVYNENTGVNLEDAFVNVERLINGSYATVESRYTDVTGRVSIVYTSLIAYRFTISKTGFTTKQFTLNPILFDSYSVSLNPSTTSYNNTYDYDSVAITWYPKTFINNNINNLTFIITSPEGTLEDYNFSINYKSYSNTTGGSNAYGSTLTLSLNISGAYLGDRVYVNYSYNPTSSSTKYYSFSFGILGMNDTGNYTTAQLKNRDYGLGLIEKAVLTLVVVVILVGFAYALVGMGGALFLGLIAEGVAVYLGFLPIGAFLISVLVGLALVVSSGLGGKN